MIKWYEGEIVSYNPSGFQTTPVVRGTVRELTQGVEIQNVQFPLLSANQIRPAVGTKIAFYRDSAATAKFGFIISDPLPIFSPIYYDTAALESEQGATVFDYGEVAMAAAGINTATSFNPGGKMWLRNTGDAMFISGSGVQRINASDSSNSIDIQGTNVDIYGTGNLLLTNFFNIKNTLGITTLSLGLRNPITGIGYTTLEWNDDGSFDMGDSLGLSGISYNLIASLPLVSEVPQISLTSVPLVSELIVNPLGLTVFGPKISLSGIMTIDGATTITGDTDITGDVSITGDTDIEGLVSIKGDVAIDGDIGLVGLLSINEVPGFTGSVTIAGVTLVYDSGILIAVT